MIHITYIELAYGVLIYIIICFLHGFSREILRDMKFRRGIRDGVFTTDKPLTKDQVEELRKRWMSEFGAARRSHQPDMPTEPPAVPAPPPPPTPNRKTMLLGFPVVEVDMKSSDIELGPPNFMGIEKMRDLDEPRGGDEAIRDLICAGRSALLWLDFYAGARGMFLKIQLREAIEKAGGYVPPPWPHEEKD